MAIENENLDLLDLEEDTDLEQLPDGDPFATPARPKKPWLLFGAALVVIALSVYIIMKVVGTSSDDSVIVNLDEPVPVEMVASAPSENAPVVVPIKEEPKPAPVVVQPQVAPTRVVEDRQEVTFKPSAKQDVTKTVKKSAAPRSASSAWYVQFGSYGTRASAESAQKKMRNSHQNLFEGKQFVVLAAVLPNGKTTYRLRIGFDKSIEANGFCQNAKSDGLDCYVAK